MRTVRIILYILAGGTAGEHQNGVQTGFNAGNNIGIHAVADHSRLVRVHTKQAQTGAHHQRVRLADIVCGLAGGQLNRRNQCAACRNDALLGRAGQVGVGRDQARALVDQINGLEDGLIVVGVGLTRDNVIRVNIVHHDARLVQRTNQTGRTDNIRRCVRLLAGDELRGSQRGSVEMLLTDLQTHACQLLLKLKRRTLGGVGQKEEALVLAL